MDKDIQWVCFDCGKKHGKYKPEMATWHIGSCDVCEKTIPITQKRDFGYLKEVTKYDK